MHRNCVTLVFKKVRAAPSAIGLMIAAIGLNPLIEYRVAINAAENHNCEQSEAE
jgi:hypothetical protein